MHRKPQVPFRKSYLFHGVWFSEEKTCLLASHFGNTGQILPFLALIKGVCRCVLGLVNYILSLQFFNLRMWNEF